MISKCANPECGARFRYLRSGKLFHFEVTTTDGKPSDGKTPKKMLRKLEHFWLCGPCSVTFTLKHERSHGVVVVPIRRQQHRASA